MCQCALAPVIHRYKWRAWWRLLKSFASIGDLFIHGHQERCTCDSAITFKLPCGGECVGSWSIHQHRHHPGTSDFLPFTGQSRHHSYGPSYTSLKCERLRSRRDVPRRLMPTTTELQSANVVAREPQPFGPSGSRKTRSKLVNALHCRSHSASSLGKSRFRATA